MSKVWFITGSSKGFGRHFVEQLIEKEDKVVATARNPQALADLKSKAPEQVHLVALDVTDKAQVEQAVKEAVKAFGTIDIVVNNAGYALSAMLEEASDEQIRHQFEVNVFGLLHVVRATLPIFRRQRSGHYINMSSFLGTMGVPMVGYYSATKFAVEGISESMSRELQPFGIKTTAVEPSQFATDFAGSSMVLADRMPEYDIVYESMEKSGMVWTPGDPAKGVKAIISMSESSEPPVHFPVGADATYGTRQNFQGRIDEAVAWEALALNTAIEA
ncbi:SDR family NAD(P)-dependent oxidoreductase [Paenibacillus brasilensis]|uniref:NAD(P)-dependent dehydrogenase (Short-subunit alcohol dehydrogenase family) n=1 Tax=Paenibacillus brasilensis TaxID=128574 RepID=A0ABU0L7E5_9BACL|nr:SDR family NAD(P)-dependent oxidoreductase [Paenibacillus brasilensis]MDQ0497217.1 NAD(P)-dependent dehydrogenase (short-subunit alcohol dehydrogenase family) [Paenibacillus brasilensis]